jgi:hypothetical protein
MVTVMPRKAATTKAYWTSILDYPASMSMYERESLAAEAKLKAEQEKKKKKSPKSSKTRNAEPSS